MERNVAGQLVSFEAIDTTVGVATGNRKIGDAANITPYCQIDGGAVNALSSLTVTEWSTGKSGTGIYYMQPSQAETNGTELLYFGISTTANVRCIPRFETMTPSGFSSTIIPTFPANFSAFLIDSTGALGSFVFVNNITAGASNIISDALLDRVNAVETGWTLRKVLRVCFSALAGKASGLDTGSPKYRDIPDTKNRIVATTDASGNRSAVTLDGT